MTVATLDSKPSLKLNVEIPRTEGAAAHFEARIVVKGLGSLRYSDITMSSPTMGSGSVAVNSTETLLYFVVVSVPEHFEGNQMYPFSYRID